MQVCCKNTADSMEEKGMDIIVTPTRVTGCDCRMKGEEIFLQIEDGTEIMYVGGYDFSQVQAKTLNKSVVVGIDPTKSYFVFLDDIIKQQLR